jgi:hypothetical protein
VAAFRAPVCFINFGLIPDRHRFCTYLYYSLSHTHTHDRSDVSESEPPPRAIEEDGIKF